MRAIVTNIIRDGDKITVAMEIDGRDAGITVDPGHQYYNEWKSVADRGRLSVVGGIKIQTHGEEEKDITYDLDNSEVYPM